MKKITQESEEKEVYGLTKEEYNELKEEILKKEIFAKKESIMEKQNFLSIIYQNQTISALSLIVTLINTIMILLDYWR